MQELLMAILALILIGGVYLILREIKNQKNTEDTEKLQKMLYELENLQKTVVDTRKETSDNLRENSKSVQERLDQTIASLNKQLSDVNQSVNTNLTSNNKILGERLDQASAVIGAVKKELGRVQELGPQISDLAKIFSSPKLRGGMGEKILEEVLSQRLPAEMWQMQYCFKSGETVDAVIFTKSGIVPIDAKFPLDNYRKMINGETEADKATAQKEFQKDVKKQISAIAKKYIVPEEHTTPFALMYLPAEDIYYEAVIRSDGLADFASENNVTIVSPNIFYHFLGIVLLSLQSQKIEQKAGEVLKIIKGVKVEADKFEKDLGVLASHIKNSGNAMDRVNTGYNKLAGKIESASDYGNDVIGAKKPEEIAEKSETLFDEEN